MDGRAFVVAAWEFNRNTATSVVFIEVFAFPVRNITLILKRRAKATCEAIRRQERSRFWCVVSFPIPIRRCALAYPPRRQRPSVVFLSSSVIVLTMSDRR